MILYNICILYIYIYIHIYIYIQRERERERCARGQAGEICVSESAMDVLLAYDPMLHFIFNKDKIIGTDQR